MIFTVTDQRKNKAECVFFVSNQETTTQPEFNSSTTLISATLLWRHFPHPGRPILWTACYSCSFSLLITREKKHHSESEIYQTLERMRTIVLLIGVLKAAKLPNNNEKGKETLAKKVLVCVLRKTVFVEAHKG